MRDYDERTRGVLSEGRLGRPARPALIGMGLAGLALVGFRAWAARRGMQTRNRMLAGAYALAAEGSDRWARRSKLRARPWRKQRRGSSLLTSLATAAAGRALLRRARGQTARRLKRRA